MHRKSSKCFLITGDGAEHVVDVDVEQEEPVDVEGSTS